MKPTRCFSLSVTNNANNLQVKNIKCNLYEGVDRGGGTVSHFPSTASHLPLYSVNFLPKPFFSHLPAPTPCFPAPAPCLPAPVLAVRPSPIWSVKEDHQPERDSNPNILGLAQDTCVKCSQYIGNEALRHPVMYVHYM